MITKICINDNVTLHLECGHTIKEWVKEQSSNADNWGFPIEELFDGTIEPNQYIVYWLIDGRLYETDIVV